MEKNQEKVVEDQKLVKGSKLEVEDMHVRNRSLPKRSRRNRERSSKRLKKIEERKLKVKEGQKKKRIKISKIIPERIRENAKSRRNTSKTIINTNLLPVKMRISFLQQLRQVYIKKAKQNRGQHTQ